MPYLALPAVVSACLIAAAAAALADGQPSSDPERPRSVFWGDTHVHSSWSLDANLFNNMSLGPDVAFRFASGEAVDTGGGVIAKLSRPLDFLVVSDHAAYLGVFRMIRDDHPLVAGSDTARRIGAVLSGNEVLGPENITQLSELLEGDDMGADRTIQRAVWHDVVDVAERHNAPGRFTAFIGYEWGSTPDGNNLHRNVIFRDGPDRTKKVLPFSAIDSLRPEDLWQYLADYERDTGGAAFAIPHNMNLSNGLMFAVEDSSGRPIDAAYANARARFEPIAEVTQIKGDSEAHPFLSPDDEFADFENWDRTNIFGLARTELSMLEGNYARAALVNGLAVHERVGSNPFKFGMIGSTDAHTSLATADDDNYWGKTSNMHPGSGRTEGVFIHSVEGSALSTMNWEQVASGYAAVWATANTRGAIFDGLRRKEAYATTGPRMTVRFFGGWDYEARDTRSRNLADVGYAKGVPMGGDLPAAAAGSTPTFLVAAVKDPVGANLQRVQIVKGWLDAGGESREKVVDVAVAARPAGGATELSAVWRDPDFDPGSLAFYYARVLEVESARWTAYEAKRFGAKIAPGTRMTQQERAYTSPIWYTPAP